MLIFTKFGQFSYFEESFENFSSMRTDYYASRSDSSVLFYPEPPKTIEGLDAHTELSYEVDKCILDTRGYEGTVQEDPSPSENGLQGIWYGYGEDIPGTSQKGLIALTIYENASENTIKGYELTPVSYSTFEGTRYVKDGRLLFGLSEKDDVYGIQYHYCGFLESNEIKGDSLKVFWNPNSPPENQDVIEIVRSAQEGNNSWVSGEFELWRKPIEFFLCRPSQDAFESNRMHTLWKFAISSVRYRVRKKLFSWAQVERRRTTRLRCAELFRKCSEYPLSEDDSTELEHLIRTETPEDLLFYRTFGRHASSRIASL